MSKQLFFQAYAKEISKRLKKLEIQIPTDQFQARRIIRLEIPKIPVYPIVCTYFALCDRAGIRADPFFNKGDAFSVMKKNKKWQRQLAKNLVAMGEAEMGLPEMDKEMKALGVGKKKLPTPRRSNSTPSTDEEMITAAESSIGCGAPDCFNFNHVCRL